MARAVQALAFGSTCLPQAQAYAQKAMDLLRVFFIDPATRMVPEVNYSQCIPGQGGDKAFAIALRYIVLVDQALTVLQLPQDLDQGMRAWVGAQAKWMAEGEQGKSARESGNNITLWYHAIVSASTAWDCEKGQGGWQIRHTYRLPDPLGAYSSPNPTTRSQAPVSR